MASSRLSKKSAAKKPKIPSSQKPRSLLCLSNTLAIAIGFLQLKKICVNKRVSQAFRRRCVEAAAQMHRFDYEDPGSEFILGTLIANCPNLKAMRLAQIRTSDLLVVTNVWKKMISLDILGGVVDDHKLQLAIIPSIATAIPNLRILKFRDAFSILKVNIKPLHVLKLEQFLFFCNEDLDSPQELIGLEHVINGAAWSVDIDESCDFFEILERCDAAALKRVRSLTVYTGKEITVEHCEMLAARMPNLIVLKLSSSVMDNEGIFVLSGLKKLEVITLDFSSMTSVGMKYLTAHSRFNKLKKICWHGSLPFDQDWLQVLEARRGCEVERGD